MIYKVKGFTLIELMVTVGIVSIVASIAWPIYQNQRLKTWRTDAIHALYIAAKEMERCGIRVIGNDYTNCNLIAITSRPIAITPLPNDGVNVFSRNNRYRITAVPGGNELNPTFTLTATKVALPLDNLCGQFLTLNSLGQKGIDDANGTGTVAQCWSE